MEKIILVNVDIMTFGRLNLIVKPLNIELKNVSNNLLDCKVGELAQDVEAAKHKAQSVANSSSNSLATPQGSLMVFCGVKDANIDSVLAAIKEGGINIAYKAVLTDINGGWTVRKMYAEMEKERKLWMKN